MHPVICKIGPVTLHSYGLMLFMAYVVCLSMAIRKVRKLGESVVAVQASLLGDLLAVCLLGGIAGGRLLYVALNWEWMRSDLLEIFAIWHGGLVWYGGLIGGIIAAVLYLRLKKISLLRSADQLAPYIALGHAFGRVGCFLNGCCYGIPTDHWLGVRFPSHAGAVLPTQLFESAGLLLLFVILDRLQSANTLNRPGLSIGVYAVSYGLLRFGIEFFRGDNPVYIGMFTVSQWISLALCAAGVVLIIRSRPAASINR